MIVSTIADVRKMDDGDPIKAIRGTITKVLKPIKGGEGQNAYHFQTLNFTDGHDKIDVKLSGRDELGKDWEGVEVYLCCSKSEKHGWTGVKVKDEAPYFSKKHNKEMPGQRVIWVTGSAEFQAPDDFDQTADDPPPTEQPEQLEPKTTPAPPVKKAMPAPASRQLPPSAPLPTTPPPGGGFVPNLKEARLWYGQNANAYAFSVKAAIYAFEEGLQLAGFPKIADAAERQQFLLENLALVKDMATTLFIAAGKTGIVRHFPTGPMTEEKQ